MKEYRGTIVSEGLASGEALVLVGGAAQVPDQKIKASEREREVAKYRKAVETVKRDVEKLRSATEGRLGDLARVLDTYVSVLDDPTIVERVVDTIRAKSAAAA